MPTGNHRQPITMAAADAKWRGLELRRFVVTVRASNNESHTMHRIFFTFVAIIERAMCLFGLDVFVQLDDSGQGLFAFERRGQEYWGLGLHVIVSPLVASATLRPPQSA